MTHKDKIRNGQIGIYAESKHVWILKVRQSMLRWYGHVNDDDYVGREDLEMQLPGKRKRVDLSLRRRYEHTKHYLCETIRTIRHHQ